MVLDQQLEEVQERLVGAVAACRSSASCFSAVEKYGEKKNTASSRLASSASANCAELLAQLVELALLARDLEQRAGVDLGELLHQLLRRSRTEIAEKSSSASASSTSRRWSASVERLARDLLGGHDRQVGDLLADVVERALGRGLDVALGALGSLGDDLLAALLGL